MKKSKMKIKGYKEKVYELQQTIQKLEKEKWEILTCLEGLVGFLEGGDFDRKVLKLLLEGCNFTINKARGYIQCLNQK